jgi:dTDP-4-dehydrorhamnose reductase
MKILILGGSGMLGHRLWLELSQSHETWATLRAAAELARHPAFDLKRACAPVDVLRRDDLSQALGAVRPDCVINCIGLIKQLHQDPLAALELNAVLPHRLAHLCAAAGARLIHISTDCVFSGREGNYAETSPADADDLYGRTKFLGEVTTSAHCLTLRTSIIGRELKTRLGLIEWFLSQAGPVQGFRRAIYTGLTTDEMARAIRDYVLPHPQLHGLYQVASTPISKYDLLLLAREAFGRRITIQPSDSLICDRSLNGERFHQATGYAAPSWPQMLQTLAAYSTFYDQSQSPLPAS